MSDEWDFYFGKVNDAVSSIFVDLGLRPDAPNEKRPWLLWIWVTMKSPRPDGLSSSEEASTLHEIEESLLSMIAPVCGAQLVGRITGSNRREFYFYGEEPGELDAAVARAMQPFAGYEHQQGSSFQPDWEHYLELLYPSDSNLQRIFNRRVLDSLAENGDVHETPRKVSHWLDFPDTDSRSACRSTLEAIEFVFEGEYEDEEPGASLPHSLVMSRVDSVDTHTINGITLELARLADEHGGSYNGWESPAMPGEAGAAH
ncbi:MAG TPA: DUF695 domain-containing protein [Steroidobacteraceae bacterium]|nr:DUF695 domain-containing protein [Steroidobacteraceae bacterium]